jgi:hypothetical protein
MRDELLDLLRREAERLGLDLDVGRRELRQDVGRGAAELRDPHDHEADGEAQHEQAEPQSGADDRPDHRCANPFIDMPSPVWMCRRTFKAAPPYMRIT